MTGRTCGRGSSENAGISSESEVRIFTVESLRIPGEGSSTQGKSGPKPRPEGVGDGEQVEIPVLTKLEREKRGHGRISRSDSRESRTKERRKRSSEVRFVIRNSDGEGNKYRSCRFQAGEKSRYQEPVTRTANRHR